MQTKNIWTRALAPALVAVVCALTLSAHAHAQEEMPVVLDEPIVQVNSDVVMLSTLKRASAELREELMKQRNMAAAQADAELASKRPELILNLINESLLVQKGKDLPRLSEDVEAEVNREVLRVARGAGVPTIEAFEVALRREGMILSDIKDTLRRQYTKQAVLQREVDAPMYYGLTNAELRAYYEANRTRFVRVSLSELFLSLTGRIEADVRARAAGLAARLRGGADFGELAATDSEREANGVRTAATTKGRLLDEMGQPRFYPLRDVQPPVSDAIKDLNAGGVSDPIRTDEGYLILRVDARDDSYNENVARGLITQDRSGKAHDEYLRTLRREAFIKPAPDFSNVIQPLLDAGP